MITDKVGGSSAKPEVSKQSKEKRLKHKVSGYKSQSKRRSIAGCRLLLRTLDLYFTFIALGSSQYGLINEIWCTRYFIELFLCVLLTGYPLMVMFCFIVAHHSNTEKCRCFHLYRWNSVWFVVTSRYQIVGRMPC